VTGHERPDKEKSAIDWEGLTRSMGTLVFLMGVKNLSNICRNLMKHGRSPETPAAMIRWGTTPRQQAVKGTLATMPEIVEKAGIKPPAILVVGEVVTLRDSLNWFETRPLFGKQIVVTRARAQASDMRRKLEDLGAEVIQFPTIRIQLPPSWSPVDEVIERLGTFDWVIFSSVNGVKFFFERLFHKGRDVRDLGGKSIAAIGPQTAKELEAYGIRADLIPNVYKAEGLLDVFPEGESKKILFPRAKVAREVLPETLRKRGHHVEVVPVYQTVMEKPDADVMNSILSGDVDVITFTASSTVHNFVEIIGGKEKVQVYGMICTGASLQKVVWL
jgi:uroporphyrinogen III methyltransferase/synthase